MRRNDLEIANSEAVSAGLKGPEFAQLINITSFFTNEGHMVIRSAYTTAEAMMGSSDGQKKVMAPMVPHMTGPPTKFAGSIEWFFKGPQDQARLTEGDSPERGLQSTGSPN